MNLIELGRPPLEGELNISCFVTMPPGRVGLMRIPKKNDIGLKSIAHEYDGVGFTRQGGRFRRRSPQEQTVFIKHAASQGLRVLQPALIDSKGTSYFPFLNQAKTLDNYLPTSTDDELSRTIYELYDDLRKAHKQNIIYGDRWSKNILINPNFGVTNIDFDIEISGKPAKEFEVAQVIYYILLAAKDRSIPLLAEILSKGNDWFDFSLVAGFLQKHALHFLHNPKYGGIENETNTLIELVHKKMLDN